MRVVGKEENSPNLIQVWSLCYEQSSFAPPIVSLQYFVELSGRGSVWSLSWSVRDISIGTGDGGSAEGDEVSIPTRVYIVYYHQYLEMDTLQSLAGGSVGSVGRSVWRWFVLDFHAA